MNAAAKKEKKPKVTEATLNGVTVQVGTKIAIESSGVSGHGRYHRTVVKGFRRMANGQVYVVDDSDTIWSPVGRCKSDGSWHFRRAEVWTAKHDQADLLRRLRDEADALRTLYWPNVTDSHLLKRAATLAVDIKAHLDAKKGGKST